MLRQRLTPSQPTLEAVRKASRILVIDDQAFPAQASFTRDQYHIERWAQIRNISQLTDGHYDVILLDLHGVGIADSPDSQGLGILEHVKTINPTQIIIAYSAQPWAVTARDQLAKADAVLDKGMDYLEFKTTVDTLLLRRFSPGYFINVINRELGDYAADVPRLVPKTLKAFRTGSSRGIREYLKSALQDPEKINRVISIIEIGITALRATGATN